MKESTSKTIDRVGLLAEYPAPIVYGGLEMQCMRSYGSLRKISDKISLVDYYDPSQAFEILHLFGNPPSMYEVVVNAAKTKKVVISAVFGGAVISKPQTALIKSVSALIQLAQQKNDHIRVRDMFRVSAHIISLNSIERDFIIQRYGIPSEKVSIIPVGVENFFFEASSAKFVKAFGVDDFVLFTGNIVERKNPLRLAKALKKLGLKGVFIGKTYPTELAYAQEFEKIINSTQDLLWVKGMSNQDGLLPSAYKAARVFCLPSFAEGQSASSLEAMAAGTPLILADRPYSYQSCYPKILRCDPMSEESIANAVEKAYTDPNRYAHQLPRSQSWDNLAHDIIDVYSKL